MNHNYWLIILFVATMVCNGYGRPYEVDLTNIHPVYRAVKQLDNSNRYEKAYRVKQKDDTIAYAMRIDMPHDNRKDVKNIESLKLKKKNNNNNNNENTPEIEYVPVSITIKKTNLFKKWPSDQNGIETSDDLDLYNTYTNNIKPSNPQTLTQNGHKPISKPSIIILEDLTSAKPFPDDTNNHLTSSLHVIKPSILENSHVSPPVLPLQIEMPPPPLPYFPTVQNPFPGVFSLTSKPIQVLNGPPKPALPLQISNPSNDNMHSQSIFNPTVSHDLHVIYPESSDSNDFSEYVPISTPPIEVTTKKHNKTECPKVSIITTNSVYNKDVIKEGCQDINIYINNNLTNNVVSKPNVVGHRPIAVHNQNMRPSSATGVFTILDSVCSIYPIIQRVPASKIESQISNSNGKATFNIEAIATVARASSVGPSAPSGPSSMSVSPSADTVSQMVETDMRTPPKLKEIFKEKNPDKKDNLNDDVKPMPVTFIYDDDGTSVSTEKFLFTDTSEGKASNTKKVQMSTEVKGIAIPVVMDDDVTDSPKILQKIPDVVKPVKDEKRKNTITKSYLTTTPSSGLSTWILLSDNREMTTFSPKKSSKKDNNNNDDKKKTTGNVSTTKKPAKNSSTTPKITTTLKKTTVKPSSTKKSENETNSTSALEALVKIQKKNGISTQTTAATTTTPKQKTSEIKNVAQKKIQTDSKKKVTEKKDGVDVKKQSETAQTLPAHFVLSTEDFTALSVTEENNPSSTTETSVENTTKKKKSTMKKKKKNKKKKKPETKIEPKVPTPAVGSQIYNFLSREIVPTVGLGLIGVALTAGLASFLGYNPFVSSTVPLRRTYETGHGYSPSNYYSYNADYNDGGQSEESLLREVLSGMPEESRYGLTHGDSTYSDSYNRKNTGYETIKTPNYSEQSDSSYNSDKGNGNYDANYSQDYSYSSTYDTTDTKYTPEFNEKYPVYTRETGTSFVYPETTGIVSGEKNSQSNSNYGTQMNKNSQYAKVNSDTIEKQPEALYRVANDPDKSYGNKETSSQNVNNQNNWHRIGTPMEPIKQYSRLEPGPRSLDLTKNLEVSESKNRSKRDAGGNIQRIARKRTKMENDADNEIDSDDSITNHKISEQSSEEITSLTDFEIFTTSTSPKSETISSAATEIKETSPVIKVNATLVPSTTTTTDDKKDEDATEPYFEDDGNPGSASSTNSVLELLRRLAQFKLKLGLNFLKSTTDMFSRYLDVIQKKVDESFTNTTTVQYNRKKNPWSRIFFGNGNDNLNRKKRSALKDNPLLTSLLTEEEKEDERGNDKYSKSTKKELKLSNKIFHSKKNVPKKYQSKNGN